MAPLVVRNLDDDVKRRLQARARRHRRSLEAEVPRILRSAVETDEYPAGGLGSDIAARFRGIGFQDGEIRELRVYTIQPATFDE